LQNSPLFKIDFATQTGGRSQERQLKYRQNPHSQLRPVCSTHPGGSPRQLTKIAFFAQIS